MNLEKLKSIVTILTVVMFLCFQNTLVKKSTAEIGYAVCQYAGSSGQVTVPVCAGMGYAGVYWGAQWGAKIGWLGGPAGSCIGAIVGAA